MASVNKVILLGHLGDAPKVEMVGTGEKKVKKATISVATTERGYKTRSGAQVQDRTDWHRVVFWDKMAEICERYLRKGSSVYVEGVLRNRTWEDEEHRKHFTVEIDGKGLQLLDKRQDEGSAGQRGSDVPNGSESGSVQGVDLEPKDDDLPF